MVALVFRRSLLLVLFSTRARTSQARVWGEHGFCSFEHIGSRVTLAAAIHVVVFLPPSTRILPACSVRHSTSTQQHVAACDSLGSSCLSCSSVQTPLKPFVDGRRRPPDIQCKPTMTPCSGSARRPKVVQNTWSPLPCILKTHMTVMAVGINVPEPCSLF